MTESALPYQHLLDSANAAGCTDITHNLNPTGGTVGTGYLRIEATAPSGSRIFVAGSGMVAGGRWEWITVRRGPVEPAVPVGAAPLHPLHFTEDQWIRLGLVGRPEAGVEEWLVREAEVASFACTEVREQQKELEKKRMRVNTLEAARRIHTKLFGDLCDERDHLRALVEETYREGREHGRDYERATQYGWDAPGDCWETSKAKAALTQTATRRRGDGVVTVYTVKHSGDFDEAAQSAWGAGWYLLRGGEIVWSDHMEPEDACLPRDLSDLVDLLNKERAEVNRLRALVRSLTVTEEEYQRVLRDGVTITAGRGVESPTETA